MGGIELICFVLALAGILVTFAGVILRFYNLALICAVVTVILTVVGIQESIAKNDVEVREKRAFCERSGLVYLVSDDVCVEGFKP